MTVLYPDVSHFQAGLDLSGAQLVMAKATEGTTYRDASYPGFKDWCNEHGVWFAAYHFLHAGNAAAQAQFCKTAVPDGVGLMIDCEPTGTSKPLLPDVSEFTAEYRKLGGRVHLLYLPEWYWHDILTPDLRPALAEGLALVSSYYAPYSDTGPGWDVYGDVTPAIWQYTDTQDFNGQKVDFNAYRGTLADLERLMVEGP